MLVGDAGIGKTRCMDELARLAKEGAFFVWSGRSIEATCNPVFWPWIQILRQAAEEQPVLAEHARALEARLLAMPETESEHEARDERGQRAQVDRYWQYEALLGLLRAACATKPLLLAFDDLHWADHGTWELLSYLGPELRRLSILIVGASRHRRGAASRVHDPAQIRDAERFKLSALSQDDVTRYLHSVTQDVEPSAALCALLHSISAGNPWFLREAVDGLIVDHGVRALATLQPEAVVPQGAAGERLRARLAALTSEVRRLLELAALLGNRFDVELIARIAGVPREEVLDALELAHSEGFVGLEPPEGAHFAHDLVRQVLYEGCALGERAALHLRAAHALEQLADPLRLGELAHHYHRALPLAAPARAQAAATAAAKAAARAQAFGDAASFLAWALSAQKNDPEASVRARGELTLERAELERLAGREPVARELVQVTIALAREHHYPDLLVRAARVLRVSFALAPIADALVLSALEDALAMCPETASPERVGAMSLLSWLPRPNGTASGAPAAVDMAYGKRTSAEAASLARELPSRGPLYEALQARLYALSGPDDIDALLNVANELLLHSSERPAWALFEALLASYRAHLYRCDLAAADATLRALGEEAQARGLSELSWHHEFFLAQRAFSTGDYAGSEASFAQLAARAQRLNLWHAPILDAVARTLITNEREGMSAVGKTQGLDALLASLVALPHCYAAFGARLAAEAGRLDLARELVFRLTQQHFAALVKDLGYVNALANLSVAAIALDDAALARAIYEQLAPYPHHNTPSGAVGFYEGAAARFLGGLAAYLGEPERARRHYDDALTLNTQLAARPLVARTAYEYARFLIRQGQHSAAQPIKAQAISLAGELEMHALSLAARAL